MKELLSDDLWAILSARSAGHRRIRAAIAYVTTPHLAFREGDLLVCDASDEAIKGGLTSASLLRSFFGQRAEVYSFDGLHAKVAIIDDEALIGSANLSENAGVGTCEAVLLTDDLQIVALIQGFIETVKHEAEPVNEEFLQRIEALPVTRNRSMTRKSKKTINVGRSRVWLIATVPLSNRIAKAEEEFDQAGMKEAEARITKSGYEAYSIRWTGKSRFRAEAKSGDVVIVVHTEKRGKRKYIRVYQPSAILYRQEGEKWTRFFLQVATERTCYLWKDIKADFASLGITNITPNSIRELTGKALGILPLMQ
jgi:hypothetical protein